MPDPVPPQFAEDIPVRRGQRAYALPYYTRADGETEILLSNPGPAAVSGSAFVVGRECRIVAKKRIRLGPHCTQSIRLRPIEPDNAGHVVVVVSGPILAHVVYARRDDLAIVGDAMTGVPEVIGWLPDERSRTYAFGYRARPLGDAFAGGAVFVSNPTARALAVRLVYYHERCEVADRVEDEIRPGCTAEYPFPRGRFGYARVQVSAPAVINVLHFADEEGSVAAAELLAEGDLVDGGVPERERHDRVLIDFTHQCRPQASADYGQFEAELTGAGLTVTHLTGALDLATLEQHDVFVVAMARDFYTADEQAAIADFVNGGGGLLVCQDFGVSFPVPDMPWTHPTRGVLAIAGAADDGNIAQDPQHNDGTTPARIQFEAGRNFAAHPIVQPLKAFTVDAVTTLSGWGTAWATVAETDDHSAPPLRPVLMARSLGAGRVVAYGDSNTFADHLIGTANNAQLGVRCVEWLLFKL